MRLYDTHTAPTPRRVRMFIAEKGLSIPIEQVDIMAGENLSDAMRAKNPMGKIPILELDDGTCISESTAICTYLEALYPEPSLFGQSALERGVIMQWQQRAELYLFNQVGMCFQHTSGAFKDRMTPVPDYGREAGINASKFMHLLNKHLAINTYLAGEAYSIADITAFCAVEFARVVKIRVQPEQVHLFRWLEAMRARPSALV